MAVYMFKTAEELRDKIADFKGFSWGSMKSRTKLGINKKSRIDHSITADQFYGPSGITAIGTKYLGIGYDYRTSVVNKRVKIEVENAEEWDPQSLPFGRWMEGSKVIIVHKSKDADREHYYLRVTYNSKNSKSNTSELFVNGDQKLNDEQIKRLSEFTAPKAEPKTAVESSQGLDDEDAITVRTFDLENILELNFGGNTYIKI
jgi:hypothetical protein